MLIERIDEVLDNFGISYTKSDKYISMSCPIHGGDNPNGLSILLNDIGNWTCFTHQCHEEYDSSIIGFIEGILKTGRKAAIEWSANFVGIKNEKNIIKRDKNRSFMDLYQYISRDKKYTTNFTPREAIKKLLKIPAPQFLNRYSRSVLMKYDVGLCENPSKSMYNRIVVPFYEDSGTYMIGCAGRSVFPKCPECGYYHSHTRCPMSSEKVRYVKWKTSSKFNAESYLYNYWEAKDSIMKDGIVILVEGPGDVWRLEEAGIHCSLALLGTKFTDSQCEILEKTNVLRLIISTDNDEAGKKSRINIESKCKRIFNVHHVHLEKKDVGEMTVEETQLLFYPVLKDMKERNHVL